MKNLTKSFKAFTLVEVLIVIIIIGILIAALLPRLTGSQARARDLNRELIVNQMATSIDLLLTEHGTLSTTGHFCISDGTEIAVANGADLTAYLDVDNIANTNGVTTTAFGETDCAGAVVLVTGDGAAAVVVMAGESSSVGDYATNTSGSYANESALDSGLSAGTDYIGSNIID